MGIQKNLRKEANVRTSFTRQPAPTVDQRDVARVTFDMLPDIALLDIFDFYLDEEFVEAWHTLVHVCQKWRNIVFGSPRRLNLRLSCGPKTRVREMLDIWPPFPIVFRGRSLYRWHMDNISAAFELNDRICDLDLTGITSELSGKVCAAIQQPYPLLQHLHLPFRRETAPVDPDLFLGGSVPCLRSLILRRLPVPGIPKLLLSATHLARLDLYRIPDSGYISPEATLRALSTLTRLKSLAIEYESPQNRPDRNGLPPTPTPQTRFLLPVLTEWHFRGFSEYLEVLVAWIDSPLLYKLGIIFFHQQILDTPKLAQFISRITKFKTHDDAHLEAHITFSYRDFSVTLPRISGGELKLGVTHKPPDCHLTSLAKICGSSFPRTFTPTVERLYILTHEFWYWLDVNIENSQWLELFHPFSAVKDLYLSRFAPSFTLALKELVGERVTEVLPALRTFFLEKRRDQDSIEQFVTARKLAGYTITVSRWERDADD
jgi:hypothetical protein